MSITEVQLRAYCADWWHWSKFFQVWLSGLMKAGAVVLRAKKVRVSDLDAALTILSDQLSDEIGEDHPALLLATFPGLQPNPKPSAPVQAMIEFTKSHDFWKALFLLQIYERLGFAVYSRILKEADGLEANLTFFKRHVQLDGEKHITVLTNFLAPLGMGTNEGFLLEYFATLLRQEHLRLHFGWMEPLVVQTRFSENEDSSTD